MAGPASTVPYGMQLNDADGTGVLLGRQLSDRFSQIERISVLAAETNGARECYCVGPCSLLKCN
ncbi:MAG: hypothetical protein ACJA0Z_001838 [Halioglobus sp.]|jgi:hypothetical protein